MLELKISSLSSYLDLWAPNPESDSCCFLSLSLYFFQGVQLSCKRRKLSSNLLLKVMLSKRPGTCCRQTSRSCPPERLHLEVEPSATFDVTIVDSCFHPSGSSRARWSDRLADECESPRFNTINQWGGKKAPFGTFVV